jgi:FkbM family methyltransferase
MTATSLSQKCASLLFYLIRSYTRVSPVKKGKGRLIKLAMRLPIDLADSELVRLPDGRCLCINLRSCRGMYYGVYFAYEYERVISQIMREMIRPGDVCFDVGANLGWYTTLMSGLCGSIGQVHSFEPVPYIFQELRKNVDLSKCVAKCFLNNVAVGNMETRASMHVFADLPDGHSSLSTMNRTDFKKTDCRVITLNEYTAERSIPGVDFVKCDVEGAELMALQGATKLFRQKTPPIWVIEIARETLKGFGRIPNDVISFMKDQAPYHFYAIDERRGQLKSINGFAAEDIGANVLCIPEGIHKERLPVTLSIK